MGVGNRLDRGRDREREHQASYSRRSRQEEGGASGEVGKEFASRYGVTYVSSIYKITLSVLYYTKSNT